MVDGGGVEGGERAEVVEGEEVEDWLTRLMGGEGEWLRLMGAGVLEGVEAGSRGGGGGVVSEVGAVLEGVVGREEDENGIACLEYVRLRGVARKR